MFCEADIFYRKTINSMNQKYSCIIYLLQYLTSKVGIIIGKEIKNILEYWKNTEQTQEIIVKRLILIFVSIYLVAAFLFYFIISRLTSMIGYFT